MQSPHWLCERRHGRRHDDAVSILLHGVALNRNSVNGIRALPLDLLILGFYEKSGFVGRARVRLKVATNGEPHCLEKGDGDCCVFVAIIIDDFVGVGIETHGYDNFF